MRDQSVWYLNRFCFIGFIVLCILLSGSLAATAAETSAHAFSNISSNKQDKTSDAQYVKREFILKLTPEAGEVLNEAIKEAPDPFETGIDWLDALNLTYGVIEIKPLYRHTQSIEEIRKKFPERSKRIPKGAKSPELRYTYTVKLLQNQNIKRICAAYAGQRDVIYAQPNYVAETQTDQGETVFFKGQ